jgi:hypothetical protein
MNAITPISSSQQSQDSRLQRFLDRAEQIRRDHVITGALELGKAAVDELFDGDLGRARDRQMAQDHPLAELLAHHADRLAFLRLTVDQIRTAMTAYEVNLSLPPTAQGGLQASQLRTLASVPSSADRARLANRAVSENWTVEATEQAVADFKRTQGIAGKGGRKPLPLAVKAIAAAQRNLQRLGDPVGADDLSDSARVMLLTDLQQIQQRAAAWTAALQ